MTFGVARIFSSSKKMRTFEDVDDGEVEGTTKLFVANASEIGNRGARPGGLSRHVKLDHGLGHLEMPSRVLEARSPGHDRNRKSSIATRCIPHQFQDQKWTLLRCTRAIPKSQAPEQRPCREGLESEKIIARKAQDVRTMRAMYMASLSESCGQICTRPSTCSPVRG